MRLLLEFSGYSFRPSALQRYVEQIQYVSALLDSPCPKSRTTIQNKSSIKVTCLEPKSTRKGQSLDLKIMNLRCCMTFTSELKLNKSEIVGVAEGDSLESLSRCRKVLGRVFGFSILRFCFDVFLLFFCVLHFNSESLREIYSQGFQSYPAFFDCSSSDIATKFSNG